MDQETEPVESDVIRILSHENPKQLDRRSRNRFDCYRDGMPVAEYKTEVDQRFGSVERTTCTNDLKRDSDRGFIRIERGGQAVTMKISPLMTS